MVVYHASDEGYQRLQRKLLSLWKTNPIQFALTSSVLPTPATRPVLQAAPTGLSGMPQNSGLVAHRTSTGFAPARIPCFDTAQQINSGCFEQILAAGKLICAGTLYRVGLDQQNEPIVLCDDSSPATKGIQLILFRIWIAGQAKNALARLKTIKSDPELRLPEPETDSELFETRKQLRLNRAWDIQSESAKTDFREIVGLLQKQVYAKKSELEKTFGKIVNNLIVVAKQRSEFQSAQAKLTDVTERQKTVLEQINDLKRIYWQLFQLAGNCTTTESQQIVLGRIAQFSACLRVYAGITLNSMATKKLKSIMQNQVRFVDLYPRIKKLLFDGVSIELGNGIKGQIPVTEALPKLAELCANLKTVSSDGNSPSIKIEQAIRFIEVEQSDIGKLLAAKVEYGNKLSDAMKVFRGKNGEGLCEYTGQSFYTPETFARLVTIKHFLHELVNPNTLMTTVELDRIQAECDIHLEHIRKETTAMARYDQTEHFEQHQLYIPLRNISGTSYMDYAQWRDNQASIDLV